MQEIEQRNVFIVFFCKCGHHCASEVPVSAVYPPILNLTWGFWRTFFRRWECRTEKKPVIQPKTLNGIFKSWWRRKWSSEDVKDKEVKQEFYETENRLFDIVLRSTDLWILREIRKNIEWHKLLRFLDCFYLLLTYFLDGLWLKLR